MGRAGLKKQHLGREQEIPTEAASKLMWVTGYVRVTVCSSAAMSQLMSHRNLLKLWGSRGLKRSRRCYRIRNIQGQCDRK